MTLMQDVAQSAASNQRLKQHAEMLAEKVFQVHDKWPHFALLLRDLPALAATMPDKAVVVSLERTLLYGGFSLFAPFFDRQTFLSVDCSPETADERGAYNADMVADPRFIRVPTSRRTLIEKTGLPDETADLVMVPNLVHHIADQDALFQEMARLLKPGGRLYVFEPTLRELHQIPDDYLRYTPFGISRILEKCGLVPQGYNLEGGPFSAIAYCWSQALQYFPPEKRAEMESWFFKEHFPQLMKWDAEHPRNLVREHTSFPVSFSIVASKPYR